MSCAFVRFCYHSYDYRPNWTTRSPIREFKINDATAATKFAYLIDKNKSFARPSRAFFNSVHFFQVLAKSAT